MQLNHIGTFLAALRRAKGTTQQELADHLHVSNKTVSKWERGESSPELSLIPVLAEYYGVTCDEILLGRRTQNENAPAETAKSEKMLRHLAKKQLSSLKTGLISGLSLLFIGLVQCVFFFWRYAPYLLSHYLIFPEMRNSLQLGLLLFLLCCALYALVSTALYISFKSKLDLEDDSTGALAQTAAEMKHLLKKALCLAGGAALLVLPLLFLRFGPDIFFTPSWQWLF